MTTFPTELRSLANRIMPGAGSLAAAAAQAVGIVTGSSPASDAAAVTAPGAASATPARATKKVLDKDAFLQILVTQLKNQDPLAPQDPQQMASQLAQFSSVEQLTQLNQAMQAQMQGQTGITQAIENDAAMQAIGKYALAPGATIAGGAGGDTTVTVESPLAGTGTLVVRDAGGNVVLTEDVSIARGPQQIALDPTQRAALGDGEYTYEIAAKDTTGRPMTVTRYANHKIDGVALTQDGPILTSAGRQIPYSTIVALFGR